MGYILKPTCLIPFIGFSLAVIIFKRSVIKKHYKRIILFVVGLLAIILAFKAILLNFPSELSDKNLRMPSEAFIVLGLNGDGSYGDSQEFYLKCREIQGDGAKKEYARQELLRSFPNLLDKDHILRKTRHVFSDGSIGSTLSWSYSPETTKAEESFLWNFFSEYGSKIWYFYNISTAVMFAFYILLFITSVCFAFSRPKSYSPLDVLAFFDLISFVGYIFFMIFWEGQAKQFYNQSGVFVMGLSLVTFKLSKIRLFIPSKVEK